MNQTDLQPFLDVAISVLAARDAIATQKLKNFLLSSPGPAHTEQSLGLAVVHFAENNPSVFDWILNHQDILAPELALKPFTRKLVQQRLVSNKWISGEDFLVETERLLISNKALITQLDSSFSKGELALIAAFLRIDSPSQQ